MIMDNSDNYNHLKSSILTLVLCENSAPLWAAFIYVLAPSHRVLIRYYSLVEWYGWPTTALNTNTPPIDISDTPGLLESFTSLFQTIFLAIPLSLTAPQVGVDDWGSWCPSSWTVVTPIITLPLLYCQFWVLVSGLIFTWGLGISQTISSRESKTLVGPESLQPGMIPFSLKMAVSIPLLGYWRLEVPRQPTPLPHFACEAVL